MRNQRSIFELSEQSKANLLDKLIVKTRKAANGCIEWMGCLDADGYGLVRLPSELRTGGPRGVVVRVNRVAYELFIGLLPKPLQSLHTCDNPKCCNPTHLFAGTHNDNMRDRSIKGRHPMSKLSRAAAKLIRERYAMGDAVGEIAKDYPSITRMTVWRAAHARTHT